MQNVMLHVLFLGNTLSSVCWLLFTVVILGSSSGGTRSSRFRYSLPDGVETIVPSGVNYLASQCMQSTIIHLILITLLPQDL